MNNQPGIKSQERQSGQSPRRRRRSGMKRKKRSDGIRRSFFKKLDRTTVIAISKPAGVLCARGKELPTVSMPSCTWSLQDWSEQFDRLSLIVTTRADGFKILKRAYSCCIVVMPCVDVREDEITLIVLSEHKKEDTDEDENKKVDSLSHVYYIVPNPKGEWTSDMFAVPEVSQLKHCKQISFTSGVSG
ncbi:hypothetical protein KQX54_018808 [Cotesia glomerata]|uniref:Uncharacterized protein n=1 Tax=Cotesia glomerata TaxID=32391 RepID=A0AAV7HZE9_COTGL|nr:hypothetical protein KQX54_018808 [Cotesia glomerata]